jgi:hypothetical protein
VAEVEQQTVDLVELVELEAVEPAHTLQPVQEDHKVLILIQVKLTLVEAAVVLKEMVELPEQLQEEAHGQELLVVQE